MKNLKKTINSVGIGKINVNDIVHDEWNKNSKIKSSDIGGENSVFEEFLGFLSFIASGDCRRLCESLQAELLNGSGNIEFQGNLAPQLQQDIAKAIEKIKQERAMQNAIVIPKKGSEQQFDPTNPNWTVEEKEPGR